MKIHGIVALIVLLIVLPAACGGNDDKQTPTSTSADQDAATATATPSPTTPTARPEERSCEITFAGEPVSYPGGYRIYCVNADGSGERRVAEGWASDIAWSSDGSLLLLTWFDNGWSPESRERAQLVVIEADGSNMQIISDHPDLRDEDAKILWPTWEPDGTRILFQYLSPNASGLYIVNADGTDLQRIDTGDLEVSYGEADITWMPGGGALAVRAAAPDEPLVPGIFRLALGGGAAERLTPVDQPPLVIVGLVSWSPDGRQLAYGSTMQDLSEITEQGLADVELFVVDIDSGSAQRITVTPDVAVAAQSWSPDGSRLLYLSFSPPTDLDDGDRDPFANLQLEVVNVEDTTSVTVVEQLSMRAELSSRAIWRPSAESTTADAAPTVTPDVALVESGQQILESICAACHRVDGTSARGVVGPELTDFANQPQIAGVVENNEENLRAWLASPQDVKPGAMMPELGLTADQIEALVAYMNTLVGGTE